MIGLRSAAAWVTTASRSYYPGQWICSRVGGGFILAYHDLPAETFERQIEALRPNEPIHLSQLIKRAKSGKSTAGLFAITVDDGVGTTVRDISGVCTRRRWPVTFYLPTNYLDIHGGLPFQQWLRVLPFLPQGKLTLRSQTLDLSERQAFARFTRAVMDAMCTQPRDRYQPLIEELVSWVREHGRATPDQLQPPQSVGWSEVAELSKHEAIRFESHGVTHTAVVALPPAALRDELEVSKQRISEHTNRECQHFCYPFGGHESIGDVAPRIVADVYESAVTMSRGRLRGHALSLVPRIPIYERDDPTIARLKILTV